MLAAENPEETNHQAGVRRAVSGGSFLARQDTAPRCRHPDWPNRAPLPLKLKRTKTPIRCSKPQAIKKNCQAHAVAYVCTGDLCMQFSLSLKLADDANPAMAASGGAGHPYVPAANTPALIL